jgi:predicted metal-dependent phosphoesterase TrpH
LEVDLHMHSRHSNDSRSKVEQIIERAVSVGLGAIAVTDHNSWAGAREAAKLAEGRILIIPGAEIKTEKGDVLALFVSDEIASREFLTVIDEIRTRDGVSVVPHPTDSPKITVEDLILADGIEAFNSTCTPKSNERAAKTVAELKKPGFASSDAHLVNEVGNGRTRVPDCATVDELRKVILKDPVPSRMVASNLLLHRTNAALNFGLKGIWQR